MNPQRTNSTKPSYHVVNIRNIKTPTDILTRQAVLQWVNKAMETNLKSVTELGTGALYCQFMDALFPGCIDLKKVKFEACLVHQRAENFKILQKVFNNLKINRVIPIEMLIKGCKQHNLEFAMWFSEFFDANYNEDSYDAIQARQGREPRTILSTRKKLERNQNTRGSNSLRASKNNSGNSNLPEDKVPGSKIKSQCIKRGGQKEPAMPSRKQEKLNELSQKSTRGNLQPHTVGPEDSDNSRQPLSSSDLLEDQVRSLPKTFHNQQPTMSQRERSRCLYSRKSCRNVLMIHRNLSKKYTFSGKLSCNTNLPVDRIHSWPRVAQDNGENIKGIATSQQRNCRQRSRSAISKRQNRSGLTTQTNRDISVQLFGKHNLPIEHHHSWPRVSQNKRDDIKQVALSPQINHRERIRSGISRKQSYTVLQINKNRSKNYGISRQLFCNNDLPIERNHSWPIDSQGVKQDLQSPTTQRTRSRSVNPRNINESAQQMRMHRSCSCGKSKQSPCQVDVLFQRN